MRGSVGRMGKSIWYSRNRYWGISRTKFCDLKAINRWDRFFELVVKIIGVGGELHLDR